LAAYVETIGKVIPTCRKWPGQVVPLNLSQT